MGNLPTLVKFSAVLLSCILDYTRADNELQGNKNLLYIYIMVFQTSSTRGYPNLLDLIFAALASRQIHFITLKLISLKDKLTVCQHCILVVIF